MCGNVSTKKQFGQQNFILRKTTLFVQEIRCGVHGGRCIHISGITLTTTRLTIPSDALYHFCVQIQKYTDIQIH